MLTWAHVFNLIIGLLSVGLITVLILSIAFKMAEYLNKEDNKR